MMRMTRQLPAVWCALALGACATTATPPKPQPTARIEVPAEATSAGGDKLPAYRRSGDVQGTVQLSGSSALATVARAWAGAFQRIYPNAKVNVVSRNSGAAVVDMAANPAVLGMMSRAMTAAERDNHAKRHGRPPLEIRVAIDAVGIFVFKDNPLQSISVAQIERIFGESPKSGTAISHWHQLGLQGVWADRAISRVGVDAGRGAYEIMRELVLRGGNFNGQTAAEPVASSVAQAVGVDPGAIGYASAFYRTTRTRLLPLQTANGELAQPTETDASSGKYPLARYLYLYVAGRDDGTDSATREFLRFVLSEDGQNLARSAGVFAIPPALALSQRASLLR